MPTRVATYNVEWFDDLFNKDNTLKADAESAARFDAIAAAFAMIDADAIVVIEAPNTTTTTGEQDSVQKLENFASAKGLRTSKAMTGFISSGRQEIALLFDPAKMSVAHAPGGSDSRSNPRFDGEFYFDADEDRILEVYKHARPPLEAELTLASGAKLRLLGVHAKSKGIFDYVDQVHLERESRRNRMKLFGECAWVRRRVDDWLDAGHDFVVLGDINDGPGFDAYELRYGRSAVELIVGNLLQRDRVLYHHAPPPKWTGFGWEPASARFTDRITHDPINVLIDHAFASPNLPVVGDPPLKVWNPFQLDAAKPHKDDLLKASDHFPVTLDLALS